MPPEYINKYGNWIVFWIVLIFATVTPTVTILSLIFEHEGVNIQIWYLSKRERALEKLAIGGGPTFIAQIATIIENRSTNTFIRRTYRALYGRAVKKLLSIEVLIRLMLVNQE